MRGIETVDLDYGDRVTLRRERLKSGMVQGEIAEELGYTTAGPVRDWEAGRRNPSVENFEQLCEILPGFAEAVDGEGQGGEPK